MHNIKRNAMFVFVIILLLGYSSTSLAGWWEDGFPVEFDGQTLAYCHADSCTPTSDDYTFEYVHTWQLTGDKYGAWPGAIIPETRGQYVHGAQAAVWYRAIASNSGYPCLEYRYFAYNVVTGERTASFQINYQQQGIASHYHELREYKWDTPMPINHQMGPDEVLGFYVQFHCHGAPGVYYEFERYIDSTLTPSYVDVWYDAETVDRYYIHDHWDVRNACYVKKFPVEHDGISMAYNNADSGVAPTSPDLHYEYHHTWELTGDKYGAWPGALIPETRGQYVSEAQAAAWYRVLDSNSGYPCLEYRYFAYDICTGQRTVSFQINYQQQGVAAHYGVLREYKWGSTMPIDYQLGPNEVLGFYTQFHCHGAPGVFYEFEYHVDSTQSPGYVDVWDGTDSVARYYIRDFCTVNGHMSFSPSYGTPPFSSTVALRMENLRDDQNRRVAGRIDVTLAGGGFFPNWRTGYTNLSPSEVYTSNWVQSFPAFPQLNGLNTFQLITEDVTPAPYNQPPNQPAGDNIDMTCIVVGR